MVIPLHRVLVRITLTNVYNVLGSINKGCYYYDPRMHFKKSLPGNSLAVQWLGLCAFIAEGPGSIPGQGTKIPQAVQCSQKKKKNPILHGVIETQMLA